MGEGETARVGVGLGDAASAGVGVGLGDTASVVVGEGEGVRGGASEHAAEPAADT